MKYEVRYGGRKGQQHPLAESGQMVAVRTRDGGLLSSRADSGARMSREARSVMAGFRSVLRFPDVGVEVLAPQESRAGRARDRALKALKAERSLRFAGRVLCDEATGRPVLYSENFFVKFVDEARSTACRKVLREHGLTVKREIEYLRNAYFVAAAEGTGRGVFGIASGMLEEKSVQECHPELLRRVARRDVFAGQWHLKKMVVGGVPVDAHASVEAAWALSQGEGVTIAILDDGVDVDHEEFRSTGKIVAARNMSRPLSDPNHANPRPGDRDNHGTACAGVAAADGRFGASGVAPRARLMPIRMVSSLGSQAEADAFVYAAQNGADVISCSWGPEDGAWWDPQDPQHRQVVPLPDSTRRAIDWAITHGRNGRGCVITWAAGNGNESVDNDGYASNPKVIAVAACSDRNRKSAYSDFGKAIWCSFPSSDGEPSVTPGIWTTDRTGPAGYNPGDVKLGDTAGNYTNEFGGTSSACPGVAGVVALLLARNPELRWDQVREILKGASDRIDAAGGRYSADGHSALYGYGRVNAKRAVELARPERPALSVLHKAVQDVAIDDLQTSVLTLAVAEEAPLKEIQVGVEIDHTYVEDLVVTLKPPAGTGQGPIVLHRKQGGGADNIRRTFDTLAVPALGALAGKAPRGKWTLEVQDTAREDKGKLRSFSLNFGF